MLIQKLKVIERFPLLGNAKIKGMTQESLIASSIIDISES